MGLGKKTLGESFGLGQKDTKTRGKSLVLAKRHYTRENVLALGKKTTLGGMSLVLAKKHLGRSLWFGQKDSTLG